MTNPEVATPPANAMKELPLKEMNYTGSVEGSIADLQLSLAYQNKLSRPLEPIFTFPLPAEATVLGVTVKIGDRIVQSELKRAKEAREDYDQAVSAGHHGAILEQHRENIFSMSVGGIEPGEDVQVTVNYNHPVEWQAGGGRFIMPLVVAPHFIHGNALEQKQGLGFSPDTDQVPDASKITPHVAANPDEITYHANVKVTLRPGFQAQVACPSHDVLFAEREVGAGDSVEIDLQSIRADRDLTVTFIGDARLPQLKADKTVWSSLKGEREEFVLLQLMPSGVVAPKPRQVVLCLDCSGSMDGMAIVGLRAVVEKTLAQLAQSGDPVEVAIVKFNNSPQVLMPLQRLESDFNPEKIISQLQASGGTEAAKALDCALGLLKGGERGAAEKSVVFVTDGDTTDTNFNRKLLHDTRIHCVGISTAVDHAVLKDIARMSNGSTYWVLPGENYDTAAREIASRTSGPLVRNVKIEGAPANSDIVGIGDLYASEPSRIAIRSREELKNVTVTGVLSNGEEIRWRVENLSAESTVPFAHVNWAKMRLREERSSEQLTELSLRYGVLAKTTAFVAVLLKDRPGAAPERVEIPVSLPHGWEMEAGWAPGMVKGIASSFRYASSAGSRGLMGIAPDDGVYGLDECYELCGSIEEICAIDSIDVDPDQEIETEPELLKNAKTLLADLKSGLDQTTTNQRWSTLVTELRAEQAKGFKGWEEEHKADLYRSLGELRGYGLKVEIPAELRARPAGSLGMTLWRAAERMLGIQRNA